MILIYCCKHVKVKRRRQLQDKYSITLVIIFFYTVLNRDLDLRSYIIIVTQIRNN